jgi:hypothetical protein
MSTRVRVGGCMNGTPDHSRPHTKARSKYLGAMDCKAMLSERITPDLETLGFGRRLQVEQQVIGIERNILVHTEMNCRWPRMRTEGILDDTPYRIVISLRDVIEARETRHQAQEQASSQLSPQRHRKFVRFSR